MSTTSIDLLRQGRKSQIWTKFCGFLDLNMEEFMQIQERLLMEQINLISKSEIGKCFLGDRVPSSLEEFRRKVPVTTYEDYESFVERERAVNPDAYVWAHTSGRGGQV